MIATTSTSYSLEIPLWQIAILLMWFASFAVTSLALVFWAMQLPPAWQKRSFLTAAILAIPFTVFYTIEALNDALSNSDFGMLIYVVMSLAHVSFCLWRVFAPRRKNEV